LNEINLKNEVLYINNSLIILFLLIGIGFLIRLYYIPFEVPISLDGLDYFAYTVGIDKEGYFPTSYLLTNFGWSTFLSPIFSIMNNNEMLELMNSQRIVSSIISVFTVFPIYFLCKVFFKEKISILGATLFLFEPRIIENSTLGITEPLFIFFSVITIMFVFIKGTKFIYISFIFAALTTFIRYEGFFLIIPILISFLVKKDFQKKSFLKICLGIILFLIIMSLLNLTAYEQSNLNILSPLNGGPHYLTVILLPNEVDIGDNVFGEHQKGNRLQVFTYNVIEGYVKYLGWIMVPVLGIFIIPGLFLTKKKLTKNKIILFSFIICLSIASLYAYGRGIQETRYLYPLIPIFVLFACCFFDYLIKKFNTKKIMVITISVVIILSIIFLEHDKIDYMYEREIYVSTVFVVKIADGVNEYNGNKFVRTAALENSWPELLPVNEKNKMTAKIKKFSTEKFEKLDLFLEKNENNGLSHLVIVEHEEKKFLNDIFKNEENYLFLKKVFDSKDLGFENQIKIFEINYDDFNSKI
jgi:hypothetical protein